MEYETAQKVWASVDDLNKKTQGGKSPDSFAAASAEAARRLKMQTELEAALRQAEAEPVQAVRALRTLMLGMKWENDAGGGGSVMNHASEVAAQAVIKAEKVYQNCDKLANRMQAAESGFEMSAPFDLEQTLKECKLGNAALETKARKVLGLKPSKEELDRRAKAKAKAIEARVAQVAQAAGASADRTRTALESSGQDPDLALVMLLSDKAARQEKKETVAKEKEALAQQIAISAAAAARAEAGELAHQIGVLAGSTQQLAWARVGTEARLQVDLWNGNVMMSAATGSRIANFGWAQREIEAVLVIAMTDPSGAAALLDEVIQKIDASRSLSCCEGMTSAADATLTAEWAARNRFELAARLEAASKGLDGPMHKSSKRELQALLQACELGDTDLATRAQKCIKEVEKRSAELKEHAAAIVSQPGRTMQL